MGAPVLSATLPELAYRAAGQGWIRSLDRGLTWVPVNVPGDTLTIGPDDPAILLTGSRATGVVSGSVDAVASWRPAAKPDCGALQLNTPLTVVRGAPRTALAVCATGSLVRSLDLGQTWSTLPAIGGRFQGVMSDDGATGRLLGWTDVEPDDWKHAQLVVSTDAGDTWMAQLDVMAAPCARTSYQLAGLRGLARPAPSIRP
jgi:photosystem II stability/assembly factor-like uncharacterized protein